MVGTHSVVSCSSVWGRHVTLVELSLLTAVDAIVGTSGSVAVTNRILILYGGPEKRACILLTVTILANLISLL